jgi:hypothetical protein
MIDQTTGHVVFDSDLVEFTVVVGFEDGALHSIRLSDRA